MKHWNYLAAMLLAAGLMAGQEHKSPVASGPKVELKGTVEKIQIEKGQGMPFLEVKTAKGVERVTLGSMRYLMEKNFSPKAGDQVEVKGFEVNGQVVAQSVTLAGAPALALRDDNGMPMWRGGRHGKKGAQAQPKH